MTTQSLHIINGDGCGKTVHEVQNMRPLFSCLTPGAPLLSNHKGYTQLMLVPRQQMPALSESERAVFMGHGVSYHVFVVYAYLDHMMAAQHFPARAGAVESYSEVDAPVESLSQEGVTAAHLIPLMLAVGDHVINDMAPDEDDSWKTLFNTAGIPATLRLSGLGESPAVRTMFAVHLQQAPNVALEEIA